MTKEQILKSIERIEHSINTTIRAIDQANYDHDFYYAEECNKELIQLQDQLADRNHRLMEAIK